jgi:hypothetical protein
MAAPVVTVPGAGVAAGGVNRAAAGASWYVWCAVLAVTSCMVGIHWDISWHRSIGRDTFWTPAHVLIYLCGVLAGISCGYLILATTFGKTPELRGASVRIWGFRGPLGAFLAAWGGIAMLTSAPFDDWWHNAYGLDVKILSPPHTVLALGILAVQLGALLLVLGRMNRAEGGTRRTLEWLYVYLCGMAIVNMATVTLEYQGRTLMHSAVYYRTAAIAYPLLLIASTRPLSGKWKTTKAAAVYMLFVSVVNWVLPLFPAEPKLGPVLNRVTQFIPSFFPLLLVVPAALLDWVLERGAGWARWRQALAGGAVFYLGLLAVQWPFANFLMSPWSRNWFFYTHLIDYRAGPNTYQARGLFYPFERTPAEFWSSLGAGLVIAIALSWLGLRLGQWLRRVKR